MSYSNLPYERLPENLIDSMSSIIRYYGGSPVARYGQWVTNCIGHGGDNPTALVVDMETGTWHCFTQCQRDDVIGGSFYYLIMLAERRVTGMNINLKDIPKILKDRFGLSITVPQYSLKDDKEDFSFLPEVPVYETKEQSLELFNSCPPLDRWVVSPEPFESDLLKVFDVRDGRDYLEGFAVMPIFDVNGDWVGYTARSYEGRQHRHSPGLQRERLVYNIHRMYAFDAFVVCEGPKDVMRLAQYNVPAVAVFGSSLTAGQEVLLFKTGAKIYTMFDNDEAGRQITDDFTKRLGKFRPVETISYSTDDPGDLTRNECASIFKDISFTQKEL